MLQVTRRQISFIASAAELRSRKGVVNLQKSVGNLGPALAGLGMPGLLVLCVQGVDLFQDFFAEFCSETEPNTESEMVKSGNVGALSCWRVRPG